MEIEKSCASSVEKENKVIEIEIEKRCASSVEKKIFLQVLKSDAGGFSYSEFYTIDLHNDQVAECPYALLANPGVNSMVSLNSVIYVVGAMAPELITCKTKPPHSKCTKKGLYHKCMSSLDLTNETGDGWKQTPWPGNGPTPSPSVVVFGGKIYLFHCGGKSKTAMVFNPTSSNKWETLLPPPDVGFFDIRYSASAVADPRNKRILVHFVSILSVYAYYPDNGRWELFLKPFAWSSELVFVDGVIYFYLPESPAFLNAYHVDTKQWLNIVFKTELPNNIWNHDFDAMIYLGSNLMCLASYTPDYSQPQTHVYFAKFKFERPTHRPADVLITVFPVKTYTIDGRFTVNDFLAI